MILIIIVINPNALYVPRFNSYGRLKSDASHFFFFILLLKNYETYNNERKEQVFARNSKFLQVIACLI